MPTDGPREWTIEHAANPPMLNAERSAHWRKHRETTKEWRGIFHLLALEAKIPPLVAVEVVVVHERKDRRSIPDAGACLPAVKAAIDSLVDAGVLPDDGPAYVKRLVFEAPVVTGRHALVLTVREVPG